MILLYFIRHFPTKANVLNLWSGRASNLSIDPDKTAQIIQSEPMKKIKDIDFNYVFTSPLKRCIQTCEILGFKTYKIDERIIERDFGCLESKKCNYLDKKNLADWNKNTDLGKSVEKIQDMYYARVLPFIKSLKMLPDKSKILIVSHSWVGRLLKYHFLRDLNKINLAPKNGEILLFKLKK